MLLDTCFDFNQMNANQDTYVTLEESAKDLRLRKPYRKTYSFPGDYIDGYHKWLSLCPRSAYGLIEIGIDGWLFPDDALKLYELAFFASDYLEIGSFKGLSTTIAATAMLNAGHEGHLISCDLNAGFVADAQTGFSVRNVPLKERCQFFVDEGANFVRRLAHENRQFQFVFVDHSHNYEHVLELCQSLAPVMRENSFVLFHDYNDPRNLTSIESYGVYQGVRDGLPDDQFEFYGVFGCTGLYRKRPSL